MGSKRNIDMSDNTDVIKVVEGSESSSAPAESVEKVVVKTKKTRVRSKRYVAGRSQVDRTKTYDPFAAIELLKRLSYSKFDGTITADAMVKEIGTEVKVKFPHTTGKQLRVAIATDELIEQIAAGTIEFDVLISPPAFVPKLAKYARVLGPKGLMPNPKNGTITNKPEEKMKELMSGSTIVKTERKQAVMHIVIGKVSMETKELVENVQALIEALDIRVVRLTLSATMSPGVRVKLG